MLYDTYNKTLETFIKSNSTVLDVGCSTGKLGEHLIGRGCDVTGIEPNEVAAKLSRARGYDAVINEPIGNDLPERLVGRFDFIVFGDVLEHLVEPEAVLKASLRHLKPEGYVLISVPNIAHWSIRLSLLFGKFDYQTEGILDRTHLRFFTKRTAEQMIERAGFRIVRYIPSTHYLKIVSRFLPGVVAYQHMFVLRDRNS